MSLSVKTWVFCYKYVLKYVLIVSVRLLLNSCTCMYVGSMYEGISSCDTCYKSDRVCLVFNAVTVFWFFVFVSEIHVLCSEKQWCAGCSGSYFIQPECFLFLFQKFMFFVLKSSDVLDVLVPILYNLNDARADQCKWQQKRFFSAKMCFLSYG